MDSDYKENHAKTKHKGIDVKFSQVTEKSQTQIGFSFTSGSGSAKLRKSDDSASVVATDSSDTSASESVIQNRITEIPSPSSESAAQDIGQIRITENTPPPSESSHSLQSESVDEVTSIVEPGDSKSKDDSNLQETGTDTRPSILVESSSSSEDKDETPPEHIHDLRVSIDGPHQPILSRYAPRKSSNEKFERDFQSSWFAKYKWLGYSTETQSAYCYACEKFGSSKFILTNWKKVDRLKKHSVGEPHKLAMTKWMSFRAQQRQDTSVMSLLESSHKQMVAKNRKYLQVIIECLMFTAQQNIAQRGHEESRMNIGAVLDINRGNFLELLHLRCKDLPWFAEMLDSKLESHEQWTSPIIQNELLRIISDFVLEKILDDVRDSDIFGIIIDDISHQPPLTSAVVSRFRYV